MSDTDAMGGLYPFLSAPPPQANELDAVLAEVRESTRRKCGDIVALRRAVFVEQMDAIIDAAIDIAAAFADGHKLLAFGNGGSATDAQDAVADCVLPPLAEWQRLPALALVNDVATVTAVANDVGFESVFARQVIAFGDAGDVALAFSTSGRSPSVLAGLAEAKRRKLLTVALVGYDGGAIAQSGACDHCLVVRGEYVPRIQEAQATVWHTMMEMMQMELAHA